MIAITGDLIDSNRTDIDIAVRFMQQAVRIAPCYFVTGNHEAWIGEDYQQLMRVSRGLGADTLTIGSSDGKVVIKSYNKIADTKLEKPLYKFEVADYDDTNDFNFVINIANMKMQQDSYKVLLWAQGEMFAAKFEGTQAAYVLAVEADSTHNF